MKTRLVVMFVLLLTCLWAGSCLASMPSWYEVSDQYDNEVRAELVGPNEVNLLKSGPEVERVAAIAKKYGILTPVLVIKSDVINACAGPHTIFVMTGLIKLINDDQLAFVIGHELGHLRLGHMENRYTFIKSMNDAVDNAAKSGRMSEENLEVMGDIADQAPKVANLAYSKGNETVADLFGFEQVRMAGYDGDKALKLFDVLESAGGHAEGIFALFASHPAPDKRLATIEKAKPEIEARVAEAKRLAAEVEGKKAALAPMMAQVKEIDPTPYQSIAEGKKLDGYSAVGFGAKGLYWLIVNVPDAKLKISKKDELTLPEGVTELVILYRNPKTYPFTAFFSVIPCDSKLELAAKDGKVVSYYAVSCPMELALKADAIFVGGRYFANIEMSSGATREGKLTIRK